MIGTKIILDKLKLNGRTAIVTGSNRGIGQYYAFDLTEARDDIIGVLFENNFAETEKMITGIGRKFKSYVCDFSDRKILQLIIKNNRLFIQGWIKPFHRSITTIFLIWSQNKDSPHSSAHSTLNFINISGF